jgi:hypothetical protein
LNGGDGTSDIEGKVTRVGASERAANEFQRGNDRRQHAANEFGHGFLGTNQYRRNRNIKSADGRIDLLTPVPFGLSA